MTKPVEWMQAARRESEAVEDGIVYSLDALKASFEVRELKGGGWLVLAKAETIPGSSWMRFAACRFVVSDIGGANTMVEVVFHGDGPGGKNSLRECRHTYWGEDGYIFYPDGALITAAFRELAEFYDDMVEAPNASR